jgi:hypothetical protein
MRTVCIVLLALLCGCMSLFKRDYGWRYPAEIADKCHAAREEALRRLRSTGYEPGKRTGQKVVTRAGERNLNGMWCWWDGTRWVGGTYHRAVITIAVNPGNPADVHMEALIHENAHYWLDVDSESHPAQYRRLFVNWTD